VRNVWGSEGYPYLVSVKINMNRRFVALQLGSFVYRTADKADNDRPWHKNRGHTGDLYNKEIRSGRATEVIVKGSQGEKVYTNSSTRSFLNLDSQWYDITTDADIFVKEMTVNR